MNLCGDDHVLGRIFVLSLYVRKFQVLGKSHIKLHEAGLLGTVILRVLAWMKNSSLQ